MYKEILTLIMVCLNNLICPHSKQPTQNTKKYAIYKGNNIGIYIVFTNTNEIKHALYIGTVESIDNAS